MQWIPVHNNSGQDFSNYIISYLQRDTDLAWQQIEVGLSKTQETVDHLQADSEYLFCVSVASSKLGAGIRSPPTTVYTGTLSGNSIFFFQFPLQSEVYICGNKCRILSVDNCLPQCIE